MDDADKTLFEFVDATNTGCLNVEECFIGIKKGNALDYEKARFHTLNLRVTQTGSDTVYAVIKVDLTNVDDASPVFSYSGDYRSSTYECDENNVATQATRSKHRCELDLPISIVPPLWSSDPDTATVTYKLLDDAGGRFGLKSASQTYSSSKVVDNIGSRESPVINRLKSGKFDREQERYYNFTLQAISSTGQKTSALVLVDLYDINDNTPTIKLDKTAVTISDKEISNTIIARVTATDPDCEALTDVTYSIKLKNGNTQSDVTINQFGEIVLKSSPDKGIHEFVITASDGASKYADGLPAALTSTAEFVVTSTSSQTMSPKFKANQQTTFALNEEKVYTGTFVDLIIEDVDSTAFWCKSLSASSASPYLQLAQFDLLKGSKSCIVEYTGKKIDRETVGDSLTMQIMVADTGSSSTSSSFDFITLTINVNDINDQKPIFKKSTYYAEITEHEAPSNAIVRVEATDKDRPKTDMSLVKYRVIGQYASSFTVGAVGDVYCISDKFDYEVMKSFTITIQGYNLVLGKEELPATTEVKISIKDINDQPPELSYKPQVTAVDENLKPVIIGQVTSTDADEDFANREVVFSIDTSKDPVAKRFKISADGVLILTESLDFEKDTNPILLTIFGVNKNNPSTTVKAQVNVSLSINDMNDNPPKCVAKKTVQIDEEVAKGTSVAVMNLISSDEDTRSIHGLQFKIIGGDAIIFDVDKPGTDGIIRTRGVFDRDGKGRPASYTIIVETSDGLKQCNTTLVVAINDINDHAPIWSQKEVSVDVSEGHGSEFVIASLTATDKDQDAKNKVTKYSIESSDAGAYNLASKKWEKTTIPFDIVYNSGCGCGKLFTKKSYSLDRETRTNYTLTVRAVDPDTKATKTFDDVIVKITVTDVNDNPPTFVQNNVTTVSVAETADTSYRIARVSATDPDYQKNGQIQFSLQGQSPFTIKTIGNEGHLYVTEAGKLENDGINAVREYNLNITVTDDGPNGGLKSTTFLKVLLKEVNDNVPEFENTGIVYKLLTDSSATGTEIATGIKVSDADAGLENSQMTVELGGFTDAKFKDMFKLIQPDPKKHTYRVVTNAPPSFCDFPAVTKYHFDIIATDLGNKGPKAAFGSPDPKAMTTVRKVLVQTRSDSIAPHFCEKTASPCTKNTRIPYNYQATIVETRKMGYLLHTIAAYDGNCKDQGKLKFSLTKSSPPGGTNLFAIDATTGNLTVHQTNDENGNPYKLNAVKQAEYNLTVVVVDSEKYSAEALVRIDVTDTNDNKPVFSETEYTATYPQTTAVKQPMIKAKATDADLKLNGQFTFKLASDAGGMFEIDSNSGQVINLKTMCSEGPKDRVLRFDIEATDKGDPALTGVSKGSITITPANKERPKFKIESFNMKIRETAVPGPLNLQVEANDPDDVFCQGSSVITYKISNGDDVKPLFAVDEKFGKVSLVGKHLQQTTALRYSLTVTASDGFINSKGQAEPKTTNALVVVTVERPLVFPKPKYEVNVNEGNKAGVEIIALAAVDPEKEAITYEITNDVDGLFEFSKTKANVIQTTSKSTCHTDSKVTINIKATDSQKFTATTQVIVTTVAVNAAAPTFDKDATLTRCIKVITGIAKGNGGNVDVYVDTGNGFQVQPAGSGSKTYDLGALVLESCYPQIVGVRVKGPTSDEWAGSIKFSLADALSKPAGTYTAGQTATGSTSEIMVDGDKDNVISKVKTKCMEAKLCDVTPAGYDKWPQNGLLNNYTKTIPEDTKADAVLGNVFATDSDCGGGKLSYSIVGGDTQPATFAMNSTTGTLVLKREIDYEKMKRFQLTIKVEDSGTPTKSAPDQVTIIIADVNDNAPLFGKSVYEVYLDEVKKDSSATSVVTVSATDKDDGTNKEIRYSITKGDSNPPFFSINDKSGEITTTVAAAICSNVVPTFELTVQATDLGSPKKSSTATVKITVNNLNQFPPTFTAPTYNGAVLEGIKDVGKVFIDNIQTIDKDCTTTVAYSIVEAEMKKIFAIDQSTGKIKLLIELDREKKSFFSFSIKAVDQGGSSRGITILPRIGTARIEVKVNDINDNPPRFFPQSYSKTITEDTQIGSKLMSLHATDIDEGSNKEILFQFVGVLNKTFPLKIDAATGDITTTRKLDFENPSDRKFTAKVRATDQSKDFTKQTSGGVGNVDATITVLVVDANDNPPIFSSTLYTASVKENVKGKTPMVQVKTTDADTAPNSKVVYSVGTVGNGPTGKLFVIDAQTGEITTNPATTNNATLCKQSSLCFDRETTASYTLDVVATDPVTKAKTATTVQIAVVDEDDSSPVFKTGAGIYASTLAEEAGQQNLLVVSASDADLEDNALINYKLKSKTVPCAVNVTVPRAGSFDVNATTGQVSATASLDREKCDAYQFTVIAFNPKKQEYSSQQVITVKVTDVNDHAPVLVPAGGKYLKTVKEDLKVAAEVFQAGATDADLKSTPASIVTYELTAGNAAGKWIMDKTGKLQLAKALDSETGDKTFTLKFTAKDSDPKRVLSVTGEIVINVLDVNDNAPKFDNSSYTTILPEDTKVGSPLLKVHATEKDQGTEIAYTIKAGDASMFSMHNTTGTLSLKKSFDFEDPKAREHVLIIQATDKGGLFGLTRVALTVTDVNDNAPVFSKSVYAVTVSEDVGIGPILLTLSASDKDSGDFGKMQFAILTGNSSSFFKINAKDASVSLTKSLDRETAEVHTLKIQVSDGGTPKKTGTATLVVTVSDSNDNNPKFLAHNKTISLKRDVAAGSLVAQMAATDIDKGVNKKLEFSLDFQQHSLFSINKTTGQVRIKSSMCTKDLIDVTKSFIKIKVVDGGSPPRSDDSLLHFTINQINFGAPNFTSVDETKVFSAGVQAGTRVSGVTAEDADDRCSNGKLAYSITSGNTAQFFEIDKSTGIVTATKSVDTQGTYVLTIKADDGDAPTSKTAETKVTVRIIKGVTGRFVPDRAGLLVPSPDGTITKFTQDFLLASQLQSQSSVSAKFGPLSASLAVTPTVPAAATVRGAVFDEKIWSSGTWDSKTPKPSTIRLVVQVKSAADSTRVGSCKVAARITNLAGLKQTMLTQSCSPNAQTGLCYMTVSNVPSSLFQGLDPAKSYKLKVEVGIDAGLSTKYAEIGAVDVMPDYSVPTGKTDIILEVPAHDLYPGHSFRTNVYSVTTQPTASFTLIISPASVASCQGSVIFDSGAWDIIASKNALTGKIVAAGRTVSKSPKGGLQFLFSIVCQIASKTSAADAAFSITSKSLSDVKGARIDIRVPSTDGAAGTVVDRSGVKSGAAGKVYITNKADTLFQIFASAPITQLTNVAVIDGKVISTPISVVQCKRCPRSGNGPCTAYCEPLSSAKVTCSNEKALKITKTTASLAGTETSGGDNIVATFESGTLKDTIKFGVWFPKLPLTLKNIKPTLYPVMGWQREVGGKCVQQFQYSAFTAASTFTQGSNTSPEVDVTHLVAASMESSDKSVGQLFSTSDGSLAIRGINDGTFSVSATRASTELVAQKSITVAVAPMAVTGIELLLASTISISGTASKMASGLVKTDSQTLSSSVAVKLDIEGSGAHVLAYAFLANGNRLAVTPDMGLNVTVKDTSLFDVGSTKSNIVSKGLSGSTTIFAEWQSPGCVSSVGNGKLGLTVKMTPPSSIEIKIGARRLSARGDPARRLGLPESTTIEVNLVYPGNRKVAMTNDPRTTYVVKSKGSSGSNLLVVAQDKAGSKETGKIEPNNGGRHGVAIISVQFKQFATSVTDSLTGNNQEVTIAVVESVSVDASPYPTYSNSRAKKITSLHPIGETKPVVHQQAYLHMNAFLSDKPSEAQSVDTHGLRTFKSYNIDSQGASSEVDNGWKVLTLGDQSVGSGRTMKTIARAKAGKIAIGGDFDGVAVQTAKRLLFTVSDEPVYVAALKSTRTITSLHGLALTTAQMQLSATLSDGTVWDKVLDEKGNNALLGALTFAVNPSPYVTVSTNGGTLTLIRNYYATVTATATASGQGKGTAKETFGCNLNPDVGDFDMGQPTGVPVPALGQSSALNVPIRVNSGSKLVGPFTIALAFDPAVLDFVAVEKGSNLAGAQGGSAEVLFKLDRKKGTILITSIGPNRPTERGTAYELVLLKMRTLTKDADTQLTGKIYVVAENDITKGEVTIGPCVDKINGVCVEKSCACVPNGRAFVSGAITVRVGKGDARRRRHTTPAEYHAPAHTTQSSIRSRRATCTNPPDGDTNGDCVFNIVDAAWTAKYVVEKIQKFQGTYGAAFKEAQKTSLWPTLLKNMDADLNTVVEDKDFDYLARVGVDMTRFVTSLGYTPTNNSAAHWPGCTLKFNVEVTSAGGVQMPDKTAVWFDISSTNTKATDLFAKSDDACKDCVGTLEKSVAHTGSKKKVYGGLIRAFYNKGNKKYEAAIRTDLIKKEVGLYGLSVVVVAIDNDGFIATPENQVFLGGAPSSYRYADSLSLTLPVAKGLQKQISLNPGGYNPLMLVDNELPSSSCTNVYVPQFRKSSYNATLPEGTKANADVLQVVAFDNDPKDYLSSKITYALYSNELKPHFKIDPKTGKITTLVELDRELLPLYTLVVNATDGSFPFNVNSTTVYIHVTDVNDNAPYFVDCNTPGVVFKNATGTAIASYTVTVRSGLSTTDEVFRVMARDKDEGANALANFTYIGTKLEEYAFDSTTGALTKTAMVWWHRRVIRSYRVRAQDNGALRSEALVTVIIDHDYNYMHFMHSIPGATPGLKLHGFGPSFLDVFQPYSSGGAATKKSTSITTAVCAVHSTGIYHDRPGLKIIIQASNAGGYPTPSQTVQMFVSPDATFAKDFQKADSLKKSCTTDSKGMCEISLNIPELWFVSVPVTKERFVLVRHGLNTATYATASASGMNPIRIHSRPALRVSENPTKLKRQILIEMPFRGIRIGESVSIPIKAHADYATASWQLEATADPGMSISLQISSTKWTSNNRKSGNTVSTVSILADVGSAPKGVMNSFETLATLVVKVLKKPADCKPDGSGCPGITCIIHSLNSVKEKDIVAPKSSALFADRYMLTSAYLSKGRLGFIEDEMSGLLAHVPTEFMMNTAVLNGQRLEFPINVYSVYALQGTANIASKSDATCQSMRLSVLKTTADCKKIFFDGSETVTDVGLSELVIKSSLSRIASLSFNVTSWVPVLPLQLSIDDATLSPIDKWNVQDSTTKKCSPVYQRSQLHATANFTSDGVTRRLYPVENLVRSSMLVRDTKLATVKDMLVTGKGTADGKGGATIVYVHNTKQPTLDIGSVAIVVDGNKVTTAALDLYLATKMSFSAIAKGSVAPIKVIQNTGFGQIDQQGGVAAYALFSDGVRMPITAADGLYLKPVAGVSLGSSSKKGELYSRVYASRSAKGMVLTGEWRPSQCLANSSSTAFMLANGTAYADVQVPDPTGVEIVVGSSTPLTIKGDALLLIGGFSTTTTIKVLMIYTGKDGSVYKKDVTKDPKTVYTVDNGALTVCSKDTEKTCSPASGSSVPLVSTLAGGTAALTVSFSNNKLTKSASFTVVQTTSMQAKLHPFPEYPVSYVTVGGAPKSKDFTMTKLQIYDNPSSKTIIRQQAIVYVYATATDKKTYMVPAKHVKTSVSKHKSELADTGTITISAATKVVAVKASEAAIGNAGNSITVDVRAAVTGVTMKVDAATVEVTTTKTNLVGLVYPRLVSQKGSQGTASFVGLPSHKDNLLVGGRFSDGTHHPELFSLTGKPLLSDILVFASKKISVVTVGAVSGQVTLLKNDMDPVSVTATVRSTSFATSLNLACNLQPTVGDVDLGSLSGFPLSQVTAGQVFNVPVRINTGSDSLGAFDLTVSYDSSRLEAVQQGSSFARTGSSWPGGIFEAAVDPPGTLKLGGVPQASGNVKGSQVEVAVIKFKAKLRGDTEISGTVNTMSSKGTTQNPSGVAIGGLKAGRKFVAGDIGIIVSGGRRHVRSSLPRVRKTLSPAVRSRRSEVECSAPPCMTCKTARDLGDTNGDCKFDIDDVAFLTTYLAERMTTPPFATELGGKLQKTTIAAQLKMMDGNLDGRVDVDDALYLARVNFGLMRFLGNVKVRPVQHPESGGVITINATLYGKGNVVQKDLAQLVVDIAHPDASTDIGFGACDTKAGDPKSSDAFWKAGPLGKKLPYTKSGLHGAFFRMEIFGPVYNHGMSSVQPTQCRQPSNNKALCTDTVVSRTAFWHNYDTKECMPLSFASCAGTENLFATFQECVNTCEAQFIQSTRISTPFVADQIGLSFLIIAYDSTGRWVQGRDAFLTSIRKSHAYTSSKRPVLNVMMSAQATKNFAPRYNIALVAYNGYSPLMTFNNTLSSTFAVNEHAPAFEASQLNVTVNEATKVNSTLSTITATDKDLLSNKFTMTYAFDHPDAFVDAAGLWNYGPLQLHPTTARVSLSKLVDYENQTEHRVKVLVHDNAPPGSLTGSSLLVVRITDANDNKPTFKSKNYHLVLRQNSIVGTAVARMIADDADSGANGLISWSIPNSAQTTPFEMNAGGMIFTSEDIRHVGPHVYDFTVRATDKGQPSQSTDVDVTLTVTNEDHLFTLVIAEQVKRFALNTNPTTGEQVCVEALNSIFSGKVIVHEIAAGVTAPGVQLPLTDLTFYVLKDKFAHSLTTKKEIQGSIFANIAKLMRTCSIYEYDPHASSLQIAKVQFFADEFCSTILGSKDGLIAPSNQCVGDTVLHHSAWMVCDDTFPSPKVLRVYDNANCNSPAPYTNALASDKYPGGRGMVANMCTRVTPLGAPAPIMYVKASCQPATERVLVRQDDGSFTENSTTTTTFTTVSQLVNQTGNLTNTTNMPTMITTTVEIGIGQVEDGGLSNGAIAGLAIGCILIWILLVVVVLRIQKQRKQLIDAKLLVLAHQGDIQFGTPEPMQKELDGAFTGGEIDPITGEMTLYKNTTGSDVDEGAAAKAEDSLAPWDPRLPSVWSGQRANPMLFNLDMNQDDDSGGEDSLGDLSDFEDADFEAFADSLLDDNLDHELFGVRDGPAAMFKNPPTFLGGDTDSLSDFENDSGDDISELDMNGLGSPIVPAMGVSFARGPSTSSFMGSAVQPAHVTLARRQGLGDRPGSALSIDSLDDELDMLGVVTHTEYESLGQKVTDQIVTIQTVNGDRNTATTTF